MTLILRPRALSLRGLPRLAIVTLAVAWGSMPQAQGLAPGQYVMEGGLLPLASWSSRARPTDVSHHHPRPQWSLVRPRRYRSRGSRSPTDGRHAVQAAICRNTQRD